MFAREREREEVCGTPAARLSELESWSLNRVSGRS